MGPPKLAFITLCLLSVCLVAAAARTQQQQHELIRSVAAAANGDQASNKQLNTYYFDVAKPQVDLSSRVSSRPERTAVTVKLSKVSVSKFMPVVNPQASGMTHSVSNTWKAFKNLATMFTQVNPINSQNPDAPRLFPKAAVAVKAASDNAPGNTLDVATTIQVAEATGKRSSWAEVTPSSVLLLPYGQSTGAVADVMDVTHDAKADAITLDLDIVHHPHTISEFEPHAKQTLDVDEAHYHFDTAPGVRLDAQALIESLKSQKGFEGLHVFMKGKAAPSSCFTAALTGPQANTRYKVGDQVDLTITVSTTFCTPECVGCGRSGQGEECWYGCINNDSAGYCCVTDFWSSLPTNCCNLECHFSKKSDANGTDSNRTPWSANPKQSTPNAKVPSKHRGHGKRGAVAPGGARQSDGTFCEWLLEVLINIIGPVSYEIIPADSNLGRQGAQKTTPVKGHKSMLKQGPTAVIVPHQTDENGQIKLRLTVVDKGPIVVFVSAIEGYPLEEVVATILNADSGAVENPVAKLKLVPTKAYRHCGDPVTLTALAVDANNLPVPNAKVAFSVVGDCHPTTDKSIKTTDANGIATVTLMSHEPGVASVVAAGVDANGGPVLSDASHIFYYVERHHADERERDYYSRGDPERYAMLAGEAAQEMVKKDT